MRETVKYHNDFNKIKLPSFTEQEQNLLFGILSKIRDSKDNTITLLSQEIMQFATKNSTNEALSETLVILQNKFFKADFTILIHDKERDLVGRQMINLFEVFTLWGIKNEFGDIDLKNLKWIEIKVNPRFAYIVNELTKNFTRFELAEFISLNGKYTKTLYRLLKQYRSTGHLKMNWQEFTQIMDIPKDYTQTDVDKRVLKPAITELKKSKTLLDQTRIAFTDLSYTKLKGKGRGRGGNVIGIEFNFKPETISNAIEPQNRTQMQEPTTVNQLIDKVEKYTGKSMYFEEHGELNCNGWGWKDSETRDAIQLYFTRRNKESWEIEKKIILDITSYKDIELLQQAVERADEKFYLDKERVKKAKEAEKKLEQVEPSKTTKKTENFKTIGSLFSESNLNKSN